MLESVTSLAHDEGLGLREHWYVVTPLSRLGAEPVVITTCGISSAFALEAGRVKHGRPSHQVLVQDGYVWLWYGDGEPPGPPPALPQLAAPRMVWERGSVTVGCTFTDFVENTLDLVHPMYAHPYTHPTWWTHALGIRPAFDVTVTPTATGWTADAFVFGRRFMWQEFQLPDLVRLVILPDLPNAMEVIAHHAPETPGTSRMEYLMGQQGFWGRRPRFKEVPGGRALHGQDRLVLEGLARNRQRFPAWSEQHASADTYTLFFRKAYALAREGRWAEEWQRFPPLKLELRF